MYTFGALVLLCAVASAAQQPPPPAEILSDSSHVRPDGYDFEYKTSDGASRAESAQLISVGGRQGIGVKGSYSFVSPDGVKYVVEYTADDKGYKPSIHVEPN